MKRRLFIFITGQYRKFWYAWHDLVKKVIVPSSEHFEIYLCVGVDKIYQSRGVMWNDHDRQVFQGHLEGEWRILNQPKENLIFQWVDKTEPYFEDAIASLQKYRQDNRLDSYWYDYLINRSGSCIEYAQIARLYDIVCSQYEINDTDILLRSRTDILFRSPMCIKDVIDYQTTKNTRDVFHDLFPECQIDLQEQEQEGREYSIFPQQFNPDQWIITLRKNLIYLMPMKHGKYLINLVKQYGDWDTRADNAYWFNAESQFRGVFRNNGFTVWEFSQNRDECHGEFENLQKELPVYAIYR